MTQLSRRALIGALLLGGCGTENIVHEIDEKQANAILVLLAENQISANKLRVDTGRKVFYHIAVPAKAKLEAMKVLNQYEYPKKPVTDYGSVYGESGLIKTAAEEKAKKMQAIEGEIEKQLRLINGVLEAEVNINMPEETALKTAEDVQAPTTASVTVKYLPGKGGSKPLSEPQIQAIVAAGVEKLAPDRVVVVMTPSTGRSGYDESACPDPGASGARGFFCKLAPKTQQMAAAAAVVVMLVLGLGVVFGQVRLRTVRGRLIKLQNEIARARRKSETPAPQQG